MLNQNNNLIAVSFILIILLLGVGIFLLANLKLSKKLNKSFYHLQLMKIKKLLEQANYIIVAMESDKLLDSALKELGIKGSTMGERLKNSTSLGLNLNDVWWAHKLRNRAAHEVGYNISAVNASKMVKILEVSLKKLGAI